MQGGSQGAVGKGATFIASGGVDNRGAKIDQSVKVAKNGNYTVNNTSTGVPQSFVDSLLSTFAGLGGGSGGSSPALFNPLPAGPVPAQASTATEASPDDGTTTGFDWSKYTWVGVLASALVILSFLTKKR